MKAPISLVLLALAASAAQAQVRPPAPLVATIDGGRRSAPVSRYEYGMFIEPIGNLVARSLWAEMLDDRKFYFPILPEAKDAPPPHTVEGRPGASYRKWRPVGGDDAVTMDATNPFVGKQSASVMINGSAPRGLLQSGLGVARDKHYDGYIWLRGDPTAKVQVALLLGGDPKDRPGGYPAGTHRRVAKGGFQLHAVIQFQQCAPGDYGHRRRPLRDRRSLADAGGQYRRLARGHHRDRPIAPFGILAAAGRQLPVRLGLAPRDRTAGQAAADLRSCVERDAAERHRHG